MYGMTPVPHVGDVGGCSYKLPPSSNCSQGYLLLCFIPCSCSSLPAAIPLCYSQVFFFTAPCNISPCLDVWCSLCFFQFPSKIAAAWIMSAPFSILPFLAQISFPLPLSQMYLHVVFNISFCLNVWLKQTMNAAVLPAARETNVFVGNIPSHVTHAKVWRKFRPFGKIRRVTICIPKKTDSRNFCGFVTFSSAESAVAAVGAMHKKKIWGRKLQVKLSKKAKAPVAGTSQEGSGVKLLGLQPSSKKEQTIPAMESCPSYSVASKADHMWGAGSLAAPGKYQQPFWEGLLAASGNYQQPFSAASQASFHQGVLHPVYFHPPLRYFQGSGAFLEHPNYSFNGPQLVVFPARHYQNPCYQPVLMASPVNAICHP